MSEQNVVDVPSRSAAEDFEPDFDGEYDGGSDEGGDSANGQPGPGMGQSKSSRRRRRKRKKLTGPEAAADASSGSPAFTPIVMAGESLALAHAPEVRREAPPAPSRFEAQAAPQASNSGGPSQAGQAQGKRWKKKFRDRDRERRPRESNPGNEFRPHENSGGQSFQASGSSSHYERPHRREGGGRPDNFGNLISHQARKQKPQSRERGFVGPMDHSYRETDPEFGELPPSTISTHGRRGHHDAPSSNRGGAQRALAENAPTHIYLFVEDLFVTAKVNETARKMGIKVAFIKNEKDALAELTSAEDHNKPSLIVFDLNNAGAKPLTLIPKLKAKLKRSTSIIGFLSHLQGDLKAKAAEAGCDVVMARSAFSQSLPNLLRRYGTEDEEEINYNY